MVPSIELQRAIKRVLSERYEVFDMVQPNRKEAYINFGDETVSDYDTKSHFRTEHSLNLHVHSTSQSVLEVRTIEGFVKEKLLRESFHVEHFQVDSISLEYAILERDVQHQDSVKYTLLLNYVFTLSIKK